MKGMIKYLFLLPAFLIVACKADQIGFLDIRNIAYSVDTVTFKSTLNPEDPDDVRRIEFHIPWQTSKLEGVDASTAPVYSIQQIDTENGDARLAMAQFAINPGSGMISLAWNHTIPPGAYVFSIGISNEGGANFEIVPFVITIIIE